ncbi:MAG: hypothetical protein M3383_01225 [Actinomycetota bacterium]|nr:hypothetical protein [Actinomycetota bacterium]
MIVSLWRMTSEAEPEKVGEVSHVNGEIRLAMDEESARFINHYACFVPGGMLTIKDGRRWLEQLPVQLRGTYFWASADPPSKAGVPADAHLEPGRGEGEPQPVPSPAPSRPPDEHVPGIPAFYDEHELRDRIARLPGLLPNVEARPAVAAKEVGVPPMVGRADVVVVDVDGSITVVECKLAKNREHHGSVVGQLLSYAAGLRGLRYEEFRDRFEARDVSLTAAFQRATRWDEDAFRRAVSQNLATGRFHLVVAVDEASKPLSQTVSYVRERMPEVDFQVLEFGNAHAQPPKRPEALIEAIRALSGAAGEAAETLWKWTKEEPRLQFEVKRFEGIIRGRHTICRIRRHKDLRVSLDTIALQLGPPGAARIEQLGRELQELGFELRGGKARIPLESLRVQEFLALMRPIVEDLPNAPSGTDSGAGSEQ